MATVSKQFKADFETWATHRIATGQWTEAEIEDMRNTLRKDLAPGPDVLRVGLCVTAGGIEIPATINDHEERNRLWADYFAAEVAAVGQSKV